MRLPDTSVGISSTTKRQNAGPATKIVRPRRAAPSPQRIGRSRAWLLKSEPKETEDRVFHLLPLDHLKADQKVMKEAVKTLRKAQRKDGGWAQLPTMESDAYATGTVLYALYHGGGMKADDHTAREKIRV
jgi:rhamnogalacturonyl hydrolase YesR